MRLTKIFTTVVLFSVICISFGIAQDSSQWALPENANARIGKGKITDIAYSPDGTLLAVGTSIGTWLYDAHTGAELTLLSGHTNLELAHFFGNRQKQLNKKPSVAFSSDGRILASACWDQNIRFWDVQTRQHIFTLLGSINSVKLSPDGRILGGVNYNNIELWDAKTLKHLSTLTEELSGFTVIAFSPDGITLASAKVDKTIQLWDLQTGLQKSRLKGHANTVNTLAFSPDGTTLASGGFGNTIRLWDPITGKRKKTLIGHKGIVHSLAFSPDGSILVSGGQDNTIHLWDPKSGKHNATLNRHKGPVDVLAFSPDGLTLASGGSDGTIQFWNTKTSQHKTTVTHTQHRFPIALTSDGKTFATEDYGEILLWDFDTHQLKRRLTGHSGQISSIIFSQNGTTLASFSLSRRHRELMLWNVNTGKQQVTFTDELSTITSRTLSPDGKTLAVGRPDNQVELWNTLTGQHKATLKKHTNSVSAMTFSPDGRLLATSDSGKTIHLWGTFAAQHIATFTTEYGSINALAFSPDSSVLASVTSNGIHLLNLETGNSISTFRHGSVDTLAFTPDGRTLASGSSDTTIRLWDTQTGRLKDTLIGHTGAITSLTFFTPANTLDAANTEHSSSTQTETTLASVSEDGTVLLWNIKPIVDTTAVVKIAPDLVESPALGEQLKINVNVTDANNITGFQVTIDFDTTALRYISSENGGFLPGDVHIDTEVVYPNRVKLESTTSTGLGIGNGPLASLMFKVIARKPSTISIPRVILEKSDGSISHPLAVASSIVAPPSPDGSTADYTQFALPDGAIARLGKGKVNDIKISPDKTILAVAGSVGIWLYDTKSGNELALLTGHTEPVSVIVFSRQGNLLVSGSYDGKLRLWNPHTHQLLMILNAGDRIGYNKIGAVAFSPDGRTLANGIGDDIQLWDTHTGQHKHNISRGESSIFYLAFSPDGHTLASASISDNIQLWDPHTGKQKLTFDKEKHGYKTSIEFSPGGPRIAFSPDGKTLASTAVFNMRRTNEKITLWNTNTSEPQAILAEDEQGSTYPISTVQFSADGKTLISGSRDGTLHKWNLITGENVKPFGKAEYGKYHLLPFIPDSTTLARITTDKTIQLFDIETGDILLTLTGYLGSINSLALSADGTTLATAPDNKMIQLWDMRTRRYKATIHTESPLYSMVFSPDSTMLASGVKEDILLWDAKTQQHKATLTGHKNDVRAVVFSPNGQTLASCARNMIRLWDVHTAEHKITLQGHASHINSIAFSPDGKTLASGSGFWDDNDKTIRLWDTKTGEHRATMKWAITSLAFSPNSTILASASRDATIQLWQVETGKRMQTLKAYPDNVNMDNIVIYGIAFSPDGKYLVSANKDRFTSRNVSYLIYVWDIESEKRVKTLTGHSDSITSLAYSADGATLVSGSKDGTVLLWEMRPSPIPRLNITPFSVESPPTGKQLTFNINTTDAENITGYEFTLQYDAKALQYIPNTEDSPKIKNLTTTPPIVAENSITFSGNVTQDSSIDDGTIATVTFEVLQPTDVTLTLTDAHLTHKDDEDSRPIAGHAWVVEPPRMPEDVNRDWQLDAADLEFVSSRLGQTGKGNTADINGDGIVDLADLVLVANALNVPATE